MSAKIPTELSDDDYKKVGDEYFSHKNLIVITGDSAIANFVPKTEIERRRIVDALRAMIVRMSQIEVYESSK
jgi:hypothetical protein